MRRGRWWGQSVAIGTTCNVEIALSVSSVLGYRRGERETVDATDDPGGWPTHGPSFSLEKSFRRHRAGCFPLAWPTVFSVPRLIRTEETFWLSPICSALNICVHGSSLTNVILFFTYYMQARVQPVARVRCPCRLYRPRRAGSVVQPWDELVVVLLHICHSR